MHVRVVPTKLTALSSSSSLSEKVESNPNKGIEVSATITATAKCCPATPRSPPAIGSNSLAAISGPQMPRKARASCAGDAWHNPWLLVFTTAVQRDLEVDQVLVRLPAGLSAFHSFKRKTTSSWPLEPLVFCRQFPLLLRLVQASSDDARDTYRRAKYTETTIPRGSKTQRWRSYLPKRL